MFAEAEDYDTAEERFEIRLHAFRRRCRVRNLRFPALRHFGWWLLHNAIVHPLLGIAPSKLTVRAHTLTSDRLNLRSGSLNPEVPRVPKLGWWLLHNLVAHVAIGLLPVRATFRFHDWTAARMGVPGWV